MKHAQLRNATNCITASLPCARFQRERRISGGGDHRERVCMESAESVCVGGTDLSVQLPLEVVLPQEECKDESDAKDEQRDNI